ncbi:MAG: TlpA family protein disulfide reductase [Terrimonas sp.]|nr:TlpA family protein disulfide reductase [Terrimonas sp.]
MKFKLLILILCCWHTALPNPQTGTNIVPLNIGDKVPPLIISNVNNHSSTTINMDDLRGKFVILDFWSSYCGACITLFPRLQHLQNKSGNKLQVILVNTKTHLTGDNFTRTQKFFERIAGTAGTRITLPVSFNNTELDQLFPSIIMPHEVIISPEGNVLAITSADQLTDENISALLNKKQVTFRIKKDLLNINARLPLFVNGNGGNGSAAIYRSLLTGYLDGAPIVKGMRSADSTGLFTGLYMHNVSRFILARSAWPDLLAFLVNRVKIMSANPFFSISLEDTAAVANLFCYDLTMPPTPEPGLRLAMQQDLYRYFNISWRPEELMTDCLVLSGKPRSQSKKNSIPSMDMEPSTLKKYIKGYSVSEVVEWLNIYSSIPLVCETTDNTPVHIELPYDLSDIPGLEHAFRKAGLSLKKERRELKFAVITDGTLSNK